MRRNTVRPKQDNERSEVVGTAMIPLWARAVEQRQKNPIVVDRLAPQILAASGINSSSYDGSVLSQVGCCIRGMLIDKAVESFAAQHTPCVSIQLGAGLDARLQRLAHPERFAAWYDLDLPEAMARRQALIPPAANNIYLSQSLFDEAWMARLSRQDLPVIIILEGVLMYFREEQVKVFFTALAAHFTQGVELVLDLVPPAAVHHAKYHDSLKKAGESLEFTWTIEPEAVSTLHPRLRCAQVQYLTDHDYTKRFPWIYRASCRIPRLRRMFNQRVVRLTLDAE